MSNISIKVNARHILVLAFALSLIIAAVRGHWDSYSKKARTVEIENCLHISVYIADTGEVVDMPLEEYVYGVVCAEMPASYDEEALKAQAVAARTFAACHMRSVSGNQCMRCGSCSAEICTDSTCCQAWRSDSEQREMWGNDYSRYSASVKKCVDETKGVIATYEDKPIQALFHAASGGATEDSENVFSEYVPYLRSVDSPEHSSFSKNCERTLMQEGEFINKLNMSFADAAVAKASDVRVLKRTKAGRVTKVVVGSIETTGRQFRKALDLRSAYFWIEVQGGAVIVSTIGYGHGVGMSQTGANEMAKNGATYDIILSHYYVGISLQKIQADTDNAK